MYEYIAKVNRVVDGDTFDLAVDVGFDVIVKERFRLAGVDTPETWRPRNEAEKAHGLKATAAVKELIEGKDILVTTYKADKYKRYLCDIKVEGLDLAEFLVANELVKLETY